MRLDKYFKYCAEKQPRHYHHIHNNLIILIPSLLINCPRHQQNLK